MNQATFDGRDSDASSEHVAHALSATIDSHGTALLREPARLKVALAAGVPDAAAAVRAIDAIVEAIAEQVPQSMLAAHSDDHLASLLPTLVDRLTRTVTLDRDQATWIVRAWAKALALPTRGLDARASAAAVAKTDTSGQRASIAEVLRPKSPPAPAPAAVEPAPPSAGQGGSAVTAAPGLAPVAEPGSRALMKPVVPTPPIAVASTTPPALPRSDVAAVPAAPPPQAWPSARPPAPPPYLGDAIAPAIAAAKPTSRGPRALIVAVVAVLVIVAIGFGAWRWMSLRQPVVATASEGPIDGSTRQPGIVTSEPSPATAPSSSAVPSEPSDRVAPATPTTATSPSPSTTPDSATSAASPATPPVVDDREASLPPAATAKSPSSSPSPPTVPPQASSAHAGTVLSVARPASVAASASTPTPTTRKPSTTTACTRASCGSVVSVRTLRDDGPGSQGTPTRGYEMTIRMDDRSIHTLTQPVPLRTGSRVRMVGNTFVPSEE